MSQPKSELETWFEVLYSCMDDIKLSFDGEFLFGLFHNNKKHEKIGTFICSCWSLVQKVYAKLFFIWSKLKIIEGGTILYVETIQM